jgi:hypothetical protein
MVRTPRYGPQRDQLATDTAQGFVKADMQDKKMTKLPESHAAEHAATRRTGSGGSGEVLLVNTADLPSYVVSGR